MDLPAARPNDGVTSRQWLALVVHELRNPLQPLRCLLTLARQRRLAEGDLLRCLDAAGRQLDLLQRLLDDLARLEPGWAPDRLARDRVSLRCIVEQAVLAAAPGPAQSVVMVIAPGNHDVRGDADRLLQVVLNLLTNAVKFTPAAGGIHVALRREAGHVVLEVCDSGRGLARDDVRRIFRPFERAQATARVPGLGIGLAIVRLFVQQHGGTVRAASAGPGRGSTFTVRLPAYDRPAAAD